MVTALLAVTNMLTAPQIQKLSKETEDKTKAEVLASADEFADALTAVSYTHLFYRLETKREVLHGKLC